MKKRIPIRFRQESLLSIDWETSREIFRKFNIHIFMYYDSIRPNRKNQYANFGLYLIWNSSEIICKVLFFAATYIPPRVDNQKMEANMKNLVVVTMTMLMMGGMLFATGCAKQASLQGMDWYSAVTKAEHERRFPQGHKHVPGPNGENCVYDEETETYFCQFDTAE